MTTNQEFLPVLHNTDDLRIREITALVAPVALIEELPRTETVTETVTKARRAAHDILHGTDDRLIVVIGPCSIHDPIAARDYAERLMGERRRLGDALEIVGHQGAARRDGIHGERRYRTQRQQEAGDGVSQRVHRDQRAYSPLPPNRYESLTPKTRGSFTVWRRS